MGLSQKIFILFLFSLIIGLLTLGSNTLKAEKLNKFRITVYTTKHYDTIKTIARKFNITPYTIRSSNKLYKLKIKTGIELYIPNSNVTLHKIRKNDTMSSISKKYYVSPESLIVFDGKMIVKHLYVLPIGGFVAIPQVDDEKLIWPVDSIPRVVSEYGWRKNPFNRRLKEMHLGLDIPGRKGKYLHRIRASKSGRVLFSGWRHGYGNAITIEHNDGHKTVYAHLSRSYVRKGAYVLQGNNIGLAGSTGRSTGPHLHYEIIKDNVHQNPYHYYWLRKEMVK